MTVFLRRKSRTATLPRLTVVSVPSQRSAVIHTVPRLVPADDLPRALQRPLVLERVRRIVRRRTWAALAEPEPPVLPARQLRKFPPLSRISVSPRARRARDWSTWNTPRLNLPVWRRPRRFRADVSCDVPNRVSTKDPTGSWRASSSGTKTRPLIGGS